MSTTSLLFNLKQKMQYLRDESEKYRNLYEEKCCEFELERNKTIEAETKLASLTRTLQLLEDDKDQLDTRFQKAIYKLNEATKDLDEYQRIHRVNLFHQNTNDEKISTLEEEISILRMAADEVEKKYEEVTRKLNLTECEFERAEEGRVIAESKVNQLDDRLLLLTNNMRSLQVSEQNLATKEENYENTISNLTKQLQKSQDSIEIHKRELFCKSMELENTEKNLRERRIEYDLLRDELDMCYRDLQNI